MLKSFRDRAEIATPGVVGHIQIGRIQSRKTRYGDKLMGGSIDHILVTTAAKDPAVAGAFLLDAELMQKLWGNTLPESKFGPFGRSRKLRVFAAGDTLEDTCDTDRALYLKKVRACHSRDGETAEWYPGAEGQFPLPDVMRQFVKEEMAGGRYKLACRERECPMFVDGQHIGNAVYKDKARATFLFRIAGAGAGIYDFDTTSEISADSCLAMLRWVERLTGGNISAVPLEMVMAEFNTQHGSTVWRVSLQIACDLPEALRLAWEWKQRKDVIGSQVAMRIERPLEDEAFTTLFNTGEIIEPPSDADLRVECGVAMNVLGAEAVGAVLCRFGADQQQPRTEHINDGNRQLVIDALREAVAVASNPPAAADPPRPAASQPPPPQQQAPPPPQQHQQQAPPQQGASWSGLPPDSVAPPELQQQITRLGVRMAQFREIWPDFNPRDPMTVGQCVTLIQRFGNA